MSNTSEDAAQREEQISSEAESHETVSLSESSDSSSSCEPLIGSNKRLKRPHSDLSDAENPSGTGHVKRAKYYKPRRNWWRPYAQELNETICDVTREKPVSDALSGDLQIGASLWAPDERETLYQALSRQGKGDHRRLSEHVKTKSALEIDIFLRILQRGSNEIITYHPSLSCRMMDIPAAIGIEADLERNLEQTADAVAQLQSAEEVQGQLERYGDLWLLDWDTLDSVASDDFDISNFIPTSDPITSDASAALELFNLPKFLCLSCHVFMNSSDPEQNYTTYAESQEKPSIRLTAAVDFYRIVKRLTARLFVTAHHCALTRIRERNGEIEPDLLQHDVSAALEILRQSNRHLRDKGAEYWIGMLRRHNIQPTVRPRGRDTMHVTIDSAEWFLRQRLGENRLQYNSSVAQAELEKACATDLTEENHLERLRARTINDMFNDYEPFSVDHSNPNDSAASDDGIDRSPGEESDEEGRDLVDDKEAEKEEARATQEDIIAASNEAEYLWQLCRDIVPGKIDEQPSVTHLQNKHRRHRIVRHDWRAHVDYKPEWEQYQKPIALDIVERGLPKDATPSDSAESLSEYDTVSDLELLVAGDDEQDLQEGIASNAEQETVTEQELVEPVQSMTEHAVGEIDTNMEDAGRNESADAPGGVSSASDSSSEVSTSSEE